MIERSKTGKTAYVTVSLWKGDDQNIYLGLQRHASGLEDSEGSGFPIRIGPDGSRHDGHDRLYSALEKLIEKGARR
jgi:hypothetical protein